MPVLSYNSSTSENPNRESNVSFSTHIVQNNNGSQRDSSVSTVDGDETGTGRTFKLRFQEHLLRFDQKYPEGLELRISKTEFDSVMEQINTEQLVLLDKTQKRVRKWWVACAATAPVAVGFFLTPVLAHHLKKHHRALKNFWLGLRAHLKELNRSTYFARGIEWRIEKDVEKVVNRGAYNRLYVFRIEIVFRKPIKQRVQQDRTSTAGSLRSLNLATPTLSSTNQNNTLTNMSTNSQMIDPQLFATLTTGQDFDISHYASAGTDRSGPGVEEDAVDNDDLLVSFRPEESVMEEDGEEDYFFKMTESPKTRLARANSMFMPPSPTPAPAFSLSDITAENEEERGESSEKTIGKGGKAEKTTYADLLRRSVFEDAGKDVFLQVDASSDSEDINANNNGRVKFEEAESDKLFVTSSESPNTQLARSSLIYAPPSPTPSPLYKFDYEEEEVEGQDERSVAEAEPKNITFADLLRKSVIEDQEQDEQSSSSSRKNGDKLLVGAGVGVAALAATAVASIGNNNRNTSTSNDDNIIATSQSTAVVTETPKPKVVEKSAEERQKAFALRQRKKFTRTVPLTQLYDIPETPESDVAVADALAFINATDEEAEEMALEYSAYSKADPFTALYEDEEDVIPIQPAHHQSLESFSKIYPKERRVSSVLLQPEHHHSQPNPTTGDISDEEYCDVDGEDEIIRGKKWRVDPERADKLPKISTQVESIKPASNRNSYSPVMKPGIVTRKFDFKR